MATAAFRSWTRDKGLNPSETDYVARSWDRRQLRFSVSGNPGIEGAYQAELAAAIRLQFPGCPADRAESIARHAATCGSGRIGRSAAGRAH